MQLETYIYPAGLQAQFVIAAHMSNFQTAIHIHSGHQPYPPSVCTARDGEKSCVYRVTIASTSIFYPTLPPLESTECAFKL